MNAHEYLDEAEYVSRQAHDLTTAVGFLVGLLVGLILGVGLSLVGVLALAWGAA